MKKILYSIAVFFDALKDMLYSLFIKLVVLVLICTIVHNVLKMGEISSKYLGNYKNLYQVYDKKMMNVYQSGTGEKTIVILAGFGSQFPVLQYKTLVEGLNDYYRVVVVEYFGYGFSMGINEERTNEKIAYEIKTALESAEIYGSYVLMAHSSSNIYASYFAKAYPEYVQGIISIDGTFSKEIDDPYYKSKLADTVVNIQLTSIAELTGFERILSYIKEDMFYIDKMRQNEEIFTENDIKVYRNRIGSSTLTYPMVKEVMKMEANMQEMKDYKYAEYLPVLEILASDTVEEYSEAKKNGAKMDLKELANTPITNPDIQKCVVVEGNHMLQFTNPTDLLNQINNFLVTF